ncbi:MAG: signal peptidase I, partial [Ardenticatenaceae bacterium]
MDEQTHPPEPRSGTAHASSPQRGWWWEGTDYSRLLPPPKEEHYPPPDGVFVSGNGAASRGRVREETPYAMGPNELIGPFGGSRSGAELWRFPTYETPGGWTYWPDEREAAEPQVRTNWKAVLYEIAETAVLTLLIFVVMRALIQNYRIEGYSMEPNLHERQYLIVNKVAYYVGEPQRGDIIVFEYPKGDPRGPE